MAHTGIFATSSEIITRAGKNYDSTTVTEAKINELCLEAESLINCITRYNWSDWYVGGSVVADTKYILSIAEASWVAMNIIACNMSGYSSRVEAETMLDVQRDQWNKAIELLSDQNVRNFMVTGV
jgi:predicted transcriptional regulator